MPIKCHLGGIEALDSRVSLPTPAHLSPLVSPCALVSLEAKQKRCAVRLCGEWPGSRDRICRKLGGTEEKPRPTFRCPWVNYALWDLGETQNGHVIPPAVAHILCLANILRAEN